MQQTVRDKYLRQMTLDFILALGFLAKDPVNPYHEMSYPFCYFWGIYATLQELELPEEFAKLLSAVNKRLPRANEKVVKERTRLLLKEVVGLTIPAEEYSKLWTAITKIEPGKMDQA